MCYKAGNSLLELKLKLAAPKQTNVTTSGFLHGLIKMSELTIILLED